MSKISHYSGSLKWLAQKAHLADNLISDFSQQERKVIHYMYQEVISVVQHDNSSRCIINAHLMFFKVEIKSHRVYISTKTKFAARIAAFEASNEKEMISAIENAMKQAGFDIKEHIENHFVNLEVLVPVIEEKS